MAVRSDLATAFNVTVSQVFIISLSLGSLKVEFSVSGVSQSAAEAAITVIQSGSNAERFPSTSLLYAAENNGTSPSVGAVILMAASPQATDTNDSTLSAGGIVGIAVAAAVAGLALGVVIGMRRATAQNTLHEEEMKHWKPLVTAFSEEGPGEDRRGGKDDMI